MNSDEIRSPRINRITWGRMEVTDVGAGKDFKLWPGGFGPGMGLTGDRHASCVWDPVDWH